MQFLLRLQKPESSSRPSSWIWEKGIERKGGDMNNNDDRQGHRKGGMGKRTLSMCALCPILDVEVQVVAC